MSVMSMTGNKQINSITVKSIFLFRLWKAFCDPEKTVFTITLKALSKNHHYTVDENKSKMFV